MDELQFLIKNQFNSDNYKVIQGNAKNKKVYIFFSSNGLYLGKDINQFKKIIIEQDRFEWENIGKSLVNHCEKIIFVRDVSKHHYVDGINNNINSVDSLLEKLKSMTMGCDIITVGNSSGGYLAMLSGLKLGAKRIYSVAGIFSLYEWTGTNDDFSYHECKYLTKYEKTDKERYYDLRNLKEWKEQKHNIFHFYAAGSRSDQKQVALLNDDDVFVFKFNSDIHGKTMLSFDFKYIFKMEKEELVALAQRYSKKTISLIGFSITAIGVKNTFIELYNKIIRGINRRIKRCISKRS